MPALIPTDHSAMITWVGTVPRDARLRATRQGGLVLGWAGPEGEKHGGRNRASCSRVVSQHPKGTEIANVRQLSIVSEEELALIAADMGLDTLDPSWLGATLVIRGIADFTHVPPSSRLQGPDGATLVIDMQNQPCHLPGKEIEMEHAGFGKRFKVAAEGRRGVTAWVERPGEMKIGESLHLHCPEQRAWQGG